MTMKIAIDIREAGQGKTGKGWYTYNLVKELLKLDKNNMYLLYTDSHEQPFGSHDNAQIKFIEAKSWKWHLKTLKDLQAEKADLFFAPTSYIIPAIAPKALKVIVTVHDLVAFMFPAGHTAKAVLVERVTLRRALKKAAAVFTVSENTKKDLLKRFRYPARKIHLTPCAPSDFFQKEISPEELESFRKGMKLPMNFILAVGTLEPRKNFDTLIKSFVIIKRKYPDYKLVIAGKKGWKYHLIEKALKHYKMEQEVIFTGYLEDHDLQAIYALAKVFVFPSLYEGFGIPPLEAMASGCPVVSSNVASMPEVIGQGGLLIDPKNAFKIADAVCSLLEDEQARQMMIERGKSQAEKFSWEESAKKALEVINSFA
jgi:glycosyltransferase involved in cell wall biosynthesis